MKDRLHREQLVSIAEVDAHDIPNQAMIGIALASSSVSYCQSTLDHVLNKIRHQRDCMISDHTIQILTGE